MIFELNQHPADVDREKLQSSSLAEYYEQALLLISRGAYVAAQKQIEHGLQMSRIMNDWYWRIRLAIVYGDLEHRDGKIENAKLSYEQARDKAQTNADRALEALALGKLGNLAMARGELDQAEIAYTQSLETAQSETRSADMIMWLVALGRLYHQRHQSAAAITKYIQARDLAQIVDDGAQECDALSGLAGIYGDLDRFDEAITALTIALERARHIGDIPRIGVCLGNLGVLYDETHRSVEAIAYYEEALIISRQIGDRIQEQTWLGNLAISYRRRGEVDQAMGYLQSALALSQELQQRAAESEHLGTLGILYNQRGSYHLALAAYQEAIQVAERIPDAWAVTRHRHHLALTYAALGDLERAAAELQSAYQETKTTHYHQYARTILLSLGSIAFLRSNYHEAKTTYRSALIQARKVKDRRTQASALSGLANIFLAEEKFGAAVRSYRHALTSYTAIHDQVNMCMVLNNIGECYRNLGRRQRRRYRRQSYLQQAEAQFQAAVSEAHEIGHHDIERIAWTNLGKLYRIDLDRTTDAEQAYHSALASLEVIRGALPQPDQRIGFLGRGIEAYTGLALLYLGERRDAKAWETIERARSRTFIEQLGETPIRKPSNVIPSLLDDEANEVATIRRLQALIIEAPPEQSRNLLHQLHEVRSRLSSILDQITRTAPDYTALRRGATMTFEELRWCLSKRSA